MKLTNKTLAPILLVALAAGSSFAAAPTPRPDVAPDEVESSAKPSVAQHLLDAVANPERPEEDRVRDADRLPAEVLAFAGVERGMTVADLMSSRGYYTEILAEAVGRRGRVYAHNNPWVLERFAEEPLASRLERMARTNIERVDLELGKPLPANLDVAVLIRFYHDFYWLGSDRAAFNESVFEALKPGGAYVVLDHHAEVGSKDRDVQTLHRVDRAMVVEEVLAAGFVLEAESDLLANPDDTRDWNIFADNAARRDQTDRFLLRFRKPAEGE